MACNGHEPVCRRIQAELRRIHHREVARPFKEKLVWGRPPAPPDELKRAGPSSRSGGRDSYAAAILAAASAAAAMRQERVKRRSLKDRDPDDDAYFMSENDDPKAEARLKERKRVSEQLQKEVQSLKADLEQAKEAVDKDMKDPQIRSIEQKDAAQVERKWAARLNRTILKMWVPAVLNNIFSPVAGNIDLFWVARLGDPNAVAGMGAANSIFSFIYVWITFLPHVVMPVVAQKVCSDNKEKADETLADALVIALAMGLLVTFILILSADWVVRPIVRSPVTAAQTVIYLKTRALGVIFSLFNNVAYSVFRGIQDFWNPLSVFIVANVANALLDPFMMFVCHFGVAGAAAATVLADVAGSILFFVLLRQRGFLRSRLRPSWKRIRPLLEDGTGVQVRSAATRYVFIAAQRRVNAVDSSGVQAAALQVAMSFWDLAGYISLALGSCGSSLIAATVSRHGYRRARVAADRLIIIGVILGLVLCGMQIALGDFFIHSFSPTQEVIEAAAVPVKLAALLQVLNGVVFAGEGILQGLRAYKWLAVSSVIGCALMVLIINLSKEHPLLGVWIGFFAFNFARLAGSTLHRLYFGPLARKRRLVELRARQQRQGAPGGDDDACKRKLSQQ